MTLSWREPATHVASGAKAAIRRWCTIQFATRLNVLVQRGFFRVLNAAEGILRNGFL